MKDYSRKLPLPKQAYPRCGDSYTCNEPCECGNIKMFCICSQQRKKEKMLQEWALSRTEWI